MLISYCRVTQGLAGVAATELKTELAFIQLMCEGHNLDVQVGALCTFVFKCERVTRSCKFSSLWLLQKYLQSQSDDSKSYDIMSAVCSYFTCLEEFVSADFVDEFIQCTDTLVELIQGPCTENQRVLLDSGIVDAGMRVLAWQPSDLKVCLDT